MKMVCWSPSTCLLQSEINYVFLIKKYASWEIFFWELSLCMSLKHFLYEVLYIKGVSTKPFFTDINLLKTSKLQWAERFNWKVETKSKLARCRLIKFFRNDTEKHCENCKLFSVLMLPAVDLLEGMLLLDPETRLTAKQGLSHPFLAEYHDPESEPDSEPYDDSFESLELAVGEWKSKYGCLGEAGGHCHTHWTLKSL